MLHFQKLGRRILPGALRSATRSPQFRPPASQIPPLAPKRPFATHQSSPPHSFHAPQILSAAQSTLPQLNRQLHIEPPKQPKYSGIRTSGVNGNHAASYVASLAGQTFCMYPITPSTEMAEDVEMRIANGERNASGEPKIARILEGEHSAQSATFAAAATGARATNFSSGQGILYGIESHVAGGSKRVPYVMMVAARVFSKDTLNVMAGWEDAMLLGKLADYTVLFASNPQEVADLSVIAYRIAELTMRPVAIAFDGFATSHQQGTVYLPEAELIKEYLGHPTDWIEAPTVAQKIVFGHKGRVAKLKHFIETNRDAIPAQNREQLIQFLDQYADQVEPDTALLDQTLKWLPTQDLQERWSNDWEYTPPKGYRQRIVPIVDPDNPGLTGGVTNPDDNMQEELDKKLHFDTDVPRLIQQAFSEFTELTGRNYGSLDTFQAEDADYVFISMGSITDDTKAVCQSLRQQGEKVGVISVKQFSPFPAQVVAEALKGKQAYTVLSRSTKPWFKDQIDKAVRDSQAPSGEKAYLGVFGIGSHNVQPGDLFATYNKMKNQSASPDASVGQPILASRETPFIKGLQAELNAAYPLRELWHLPVTENPDIVPKGTLRIRFHGVGGYGVMKTGKIFDKVLEDYLGGYSKATPKYGSEKKGAPTSFYLTESPEEVLPANSVLKAVECVICPDGEAFQHTNPIEGLVENGILILQSHQDPLTTWQQLPQSARKQIREKKIRFYTIDAFRAAAKFATDETLKTRMMGMAFLGALANVIPPTQGKTIEDSIQKTLEKTFSPAVCAANLQVIHEGQKTTSIDYDHIEFIQSDSTESSRAASQFASVPLPSFSPTNLFDPNYFKEVYLNGVFPGVNLGLPPGTASQKNKGLFRTYAPIFDESKCTGCTDCAFICPDSAIPNTAHTIHQLLSSGTDTLTIPDAQKAALYRVLPEVESRMRQTYLEQTEETFQPFSRVLADAVKPEYSKVELQPGLQALVDIFQGYQAAKTVKFFEAYEGDGQTGGLYNLVIDPTKCTGCMECVDVCGSGALIDPTIFTSPIIQEAQEEKEAVQ